MTDNTTPAGLPPIDYSLLAEHLGSGAANLLCTTKWKDGIDLEVPHDGVISLLHAYALAAIACQEAK